MTSQETPFSHSFSLFCDTSRKDEILIIYEKVTLDVAAMKNIILKYFKYSI